MSLPTNQNFRLIACVNCGAPHTEHLTLAETEVIHAGHLKGLPLRVVTCGGCGLAFLNPQPTPEALGRFYEHEYYQGRKVKNVSVEARLKQTQWQRDILYTWLTANLPPIRNWRVLDIGCGYGEWLRHFDASNHVLGIEQSRQAAEAANQRFGVEVRQCDFMANGFPDDDLDMVTGLAIIEHFTDPLAALVETNRLLKPGGHVFLQTPDLLGLVLRKGQSSFFKVVHTYYYSLATLSSLCRKAGFEIVAGRRRAPVLSTSDRLRPGNFWSGELDVLARKVKRVSLAEAQATSGTGDDPQEVIRTVAAARERDEPYVRMARLYRRPVIGPVAKTLVQAGYLLTGRNIRRRSYHEAQLALLNNAK